MTGLLNRFGLHEAFQALPRGESQIVAVHAFDLDGFKAVNDAFGHRAGDKLLVILAERIRSIVPEGTIMARTGGDEFVLVQLGTGWDEEAQHLAERIHRELTQAYDIASTRPVTVGLSLGYAREILSQTDLDDLIQRADACSYAIKREGGGVRGFCHEADRRMANPDALPNDLRPPAVSNVSSPIVPSTAIRAIRPVMA